MLSFHSSSAGTVLHINDYWKLNRSRLVLKYCNTVEVFVLLPGWLFCTIMSKIINRSDFFHPKSICNVHVTTYYTAFHQISNMTVHYPLNVFLSSKPHARNSFFLWKLYKWANKIFLIFCIQLFTLVASSCVISGIMNI